jgi:asparagine synthase (glutamine-hydrolysing)
VCGIAGVAGERASHAALKGMADAMWQRGPDGEGVWSGEGVGLAQRRLAIIDLHERANQPMHLERWHLVFNGEIYNYREVRAELEGLGHSFRTEGDTEVLLHAWAEWGRGALDRINGMFGFAVWDEDKRMLTLACDPFGEKPLFYWEKEGRLVFASDLRALWCRPDTPPSHDEGTLASYLVRGRPRPDVTRTFAAGVRRLPAAHLLEWRHGGSAVSRYWSPRPVEVPRRYDDAVEQYRALLLDSVRLRLRSDVPVGTSLSGGLDSSAIVALVREASGDRSRHAFTARFPGHPQDEWGYAAAVADHAEVAVHHAVEPDAEGLLQDLGRFVDDQQEPVGSCSVYAQWSVMRAAHEAGITVLLDGQGNDELLGGYGEAPGFAVRSAGAGALLRAMGSRAELSSVVRSLAEDHLPTGAGRAYLNRDAPPYLSRATALEGSRALLPRPKPNDSGGTFRRYLLRQTTDASLPLLLLYADRSSMAHSREVRLPFLDRRVAEFSLSLPPSFAYERGLSKRILRDALRADVPAAVLDRRDKIGFSPPQENWMNTPAVRDRVGEVLLDEASRRRGLYDPAAIEADLRARRWRDHGGIWRAFNAELWLRAAEERSAGRSAVAAEVG